LLNYLKLYNHHIPQRALDAKTPVQALKEWQQTRPELFVKRVYDQTGFDRPGVSNDSSHGRLPFDSRDGEFAATACVPLQS